MSTFKPTTIRQAVDFLFATNSDGDSKNIEQSPPEAFHMTAGLALRNSWGLWQKESALKSDAIATYGIAHPDDISALILAWLSAREKREEFDPVKYCDRFHAHWKSFGMSSLEAGGVKTPDSTRPEEGTCVCCGAANQTGKYKTWTTCLECYTSGRLAEWERSQESP